MFETGMKNLLTQGYQQFASTDEQATLQKAARAMRINVKSAGNCVYGDALFQKPLDATVFAGISLAATATSGTSVVQAFDAATFINAGASANYTLTVATKELKATSTATPCTVVSNPFTISALNYCVLKAGTVAGTGTVSYFISRDNGVNFRQIYAGMILSGTPAGTAFVFKIVITGNSTLTGGIGFLLR
jgi:hypothetical protein